MNRVRNYGLCILLLATAFVVASCGVKPNRLAQPQGTEKNDFPRKYPMPDGSF